MVQITAWRRAGDKPLSEPMMGILLTHICVTRPQWVTSIILTLKRCNWKYHVITVINTDLSRFVVTVLVRTELPVSHAPSCNETTNPCRIGLNPLNELNGKVNCHQRALGIQNYVQLLYIVRICASIRGLFFFFAPLGSNIIYANTIGMKDGFISQKCPCAYSDIMNEWRECISYMWASVTEAGM